MRIAWLGLGWTGAAVACSDLVVGDLKAASQVFSACGAVVLQFGDGVYGETLSILNLVSVVEMALETKQFVQVANGIDRAAQFSALPDLLFPNQLLFPAVEVLAMEVGEEMDLDFCLDRQAGPCPPSSFRHVEVEEGDLVVLDPFRVSMRLCKPQDNGPTRPCQTSLTRLQVDELVLRFRSSGFVLPVSATVRELQVGLGSGSDDQEVLFALAAKAG